MNENQFNKDSTDAVLSAILTRLSGIETQLRDDKRERDQWRNDLTSRISAIESWRVWAVGLAAGVSTAVAGFWQWFTHHK